MKVFLIQSKHKKRDRFILNPPYGLLYLASVMRQAGIETKIYDANIEFYDTLDEYYQRITATIESWKPDIIGIGGMVSGFLFVQECTALLKQRFPEIPILGGGLIISAMPDLVMKNTSIDIGCVGEAEEVIVDLVQRVVQKQPLGHIDGLLIREGNEIRKTGFASIIKGRRQRGRPGIDWIPMPAYDLIDLNQYLPYQSFCYELLERHFERQNLDKSKLAKISKNAMPIFAGRGCPFQCVFCFSTMNKKPVKHSVEYVIKHLEYLEKTYGINHFQFMDENFNFEKAWVQEFCKRMQEKGNPYYFTTGNRNRVGFFDEEMLDLLKATNFYDISVGVESLDDKILIDINRRMKAEKIIGCLQMIKRHGIDQEFIRCLWGFPADTYGTMYGSIRRGNALGYKTLFALVIPLPGTEIYRQCLEKGIITDEVAYMRELFHTDGYRNMTKFASVTEVLQIIAEGNNISELHYALKNRDLPEALRQIWKFAVLKTRHMGVLLFERFGVKERVRQLLGF